MTGATTERGLGDVMLVGSMPYDDAETMLRKAGPALRGHAAFLPDGEVGERRNWVGMLAQMVYSRHPELEETAAPPGRALEQPDRDAEGPPLEELPGLCVRMSNEAASRTGRRLDYVHMPVVRHPTPEFFAPLADLDIGDTSVFLGMVHHTDGLDDFRNRLDLARRHLPDFGVAGVCGYGRVDPSELDHVLAVHAECATLL